MQWNWKIQSSSATKWEITPASINSRSTSWLILLPKLSIKPSIHMELRGTRGSTSSQDPRGQPIGFSIATTGTPVSSIITAVRQQDYSASVWLRRREKLEHVSWISRTRLFRITIWRKRQMKLKWNAAVKNTVLTKYETHTLIGKATIAKYVGVYMLPLTCHKCHICAFFSGWGRLPTPLLYWIAVC